MARKDHRGRSVGGDRYVRLFHYMTNSEAWRSLDAVARALYVEITRRYMGSNNGRIPYSVREGAENLNVGKATVMRALKKLEDHGFIVPTKIGAFSLKARHATEWRLTEFPCNLTNAAVATKEFVRWQQPGGSLATAPHRGRVASPVPGNLRVYPQ
jgi:DNA-binding transcriptional regulator YhcF (GntR family)